MSKPVNVIAATNAKGQVKFLAKTPMVFRESANANAQGFLKN
jgi:hypothetical protein